LPTDGAEASWKSKSKTASISLPNVTIKTDAEPDACLAKAKATIQSAIQDGPAIV
jgi:hypothetical protein